MNKEERDWGGFEILYEGSNHKVKILTINPGKCISYQRHTHRAEEWHLLEGEWEYIIEDSVGHERLAVIPKLFWHQVRNIGDVPVKILEIQSGTYFGEDDIERLTREWYLTASIGAIER